MPRDLRSLALLAAVAIALGVLLASWFRAWLRPFRLRRRFRHAALGEDRAAGLLARAGYEVLARRVAHSWNVAVDGEPVAIALVADYVVARGDKRFVAEVKTGTKAPSVRTATTRRQMLEYRVAFDVDGVLLVDADEGLVQEVTFASPDTLEQKPRWRLWVLAAIAVGSVVGWCARSYGALG